MRRTWRTGKRNDWTSGNSDAGTFENEDIWIQRNRKIGEFEEKRQTLTVSRFPNLLISQTGKERKYGDQAYADRRQGAREAPGG